MVSDPEVLDAALAYLGLGWSVLPLCPPDHVGVGKRHRGCQSPGKRPFFPDRDAGSGEWKEFQTRRATEGEVRRWWDKHPRLNVGAAMGPVSGLAAVDVDDEEGEELLVALSGGDLPETWEYTTGKGRRLLYRLPPGADVRTQSFPRPGTEIEILRLLGRGGQVVLPPSVHPNGSAYRWKPFHDPNSIPAADVPGWMLSVGGHDARPAPADGELITQGGRNNYLTSLAGAMRKRGAAEGVILAALRATNETRFDPPLPDREVESVARSVARYEPDEFSGVGYKLPEPGRLPPVGADRGRRFKWASELTAPPKADEWLWEGYLPRSGIVLLSALWKAGKTTLLSHLLRAFAESGSFLGQQIRASRVLYVSEEGERHWVRRRDDLRIGDHAGFYLQPFAAKPSSADWLGFLAGLKADVLAHGFDLVVFDTLAKLWPVTEENDAGQVDAALMPLWEVTKAGAGVLLIHHLRKSGGQEYTGSRGSGALSAFPDIVVELTRFDPGNPKDRKRKLNAKGRYDETPDEVILELVGGQYCLVSAPPAGTPAPAPVGTAVPVMVVPEHATEEGRIRIVLREHPTPWLQVEDIRAGLKARKWGMRNEDIATHLFSLYAKNEVSIRGVVRSKTDPREYALSSRSTPGGVNGNDIPGRDESVNGFYEDENN